MQAKLQRKYIHNIEVYPGDFNVSVVVVGQRDVHVPGVACASLETMEYTKPTSCGQLHESNLLCKQGRNDTTDSNC